MTCRVVATDLGAYVLGALDPSERRRVDEHVGECPVCAAELSEFAVLPALLDRVGSEDLQVPAVTPSSDLFERFSAAAAADRPRTSIRARKARAARSGQRPRGRLLLVAAAVVAVVGAGAGITRWALGPTEVTRSVVAGDVRMTVTATARGDGTALDVVVAGLPAEENCRLVVVDRDGGRHQAGEWSATYAGEAWFKGWSDVDRSAVHDVVLLGTEGQELVRVPL